MTLVKTVVVLAVTGLALWGAQTYIPASPAIKAVIIAALITILCLWLLQTFGVLDGIRGVRGP